MYRKNTHKMTIFLVYVYWNLKNKKEKKAAQSPPMPVRTVGSGHPSSLTDTPSGVSGH